jgi:MFS transporter, OFA family, oxalate/formate antiporter
LEFEGFFDAADSCNIWGIAKLDIIYPAVSIAYGISGIMGPIVGGIIKDLTGSYYLAIILGGIICVSGIAVYSTLKWPEKRLVKGAAKLPAGDPDTSKKRIHRLAEGRTQH